MLLGKFYRGADAREISGYGHTEFYEAIRTGDFPQPDGHLGPRSPFWTEATLLEWQRQQLAKPKLPPVQIRRRRNGK